MAIPARKPAPSKPRRAWLLALGGTVLFGALLRLWAAYDEFWLDEVASLAIALNAKSLGEIFTRFHIDNNHHLVTIWMYLCGSVSNWVVYRIPAIVSGIATIPLAAMVGRRWGQSAALACAVLVATSYGMIVFASEARGYAPAGFFALVAYLALDRYLETSHWRAAAVFAGAVILGLLSHLTFMHFYVAAGIWSALALYRQRPTLRGYCQSLLACHGAPGIFLLALYWVDLRWMKVAGGGDYQMADVVVESLALAVGLVGTHAQMIPVACAALALLAWGLLAMWRDDRPRAVFFAVVIIISPAVVFMVHRPGFIYPRYFYFSWLFFLILLGYMLSTIEASWKHGRLAMGGAVACLALANLWTARDFLLLGRGHYLEAIQYMVANTPEQTLVVSSDHDYRNGAMLHFYAPRALGTKKLEFLPADSADVGRARWRILHSSRLPYRPAPEIDGPAGEAWVLEQVFPYAGLSGFHWAVYRRAVLDDKSTNALQR